MCACSIKEGGHMELKSSSIARRFLFVYAWLSKMQAQGSFTGTGWFSHTGIPTHIRTDRVSSSVNLCNTATDADLDLQGLRCYHAPQMLDSRYSYRSWALFCTPSRGQAIRALLSCIERVNLTNKSTKTGHRCLKLAESDWDWLKLINHLETE